METDSNKEKMGSPIWEVEKLLLLLCHDYPHRYSYLVFKDKKVK